MESASPPPQPRRLRHRRLLVALLLMISGAVVGLVGYAMYLSSDTYRHRVERTLGERLGMRVEIGRLRPFPWKRVLTDARVFLEPGGRQVFSCRQAEWRFGTSDRHRVLVLRHGWLLLGASNWAQDDYRRMLAGGFRHDFARLRVGQIQLDDIDLRFSHTSAEFVANGASGIVLVDEGGAGQVVVRCDRLNGDRMEAPLHVAARFTSGAEFVFDEVRLDVPLMPLNLLKLGRLLPQDEARTGLLFHAAGLSQGTFRGSIVYRNLSDQERVELNGAISGVDLAEVTMRFPGGPVHGTVELDLSEAVFEQRALTRLDLSAGAANVVLSTLLPGIGVADEETTLSLRMDELRWTREGIEYFRGSGRCTNLSLDAISSLVGRGRITGVATAEIDSIVIVNDQLRHVDAIIEAHPPPDGPGLIHRDAITEVGKLWLGANLSVVLPEEVEYVRLGVHVTVDDGTLRLHGTHGPDHETILTANVFGRPWRVIRAPERTFPLPDLVRSVRDRLRQLNLETLRARWLALRGKETEPQP